MNRSGHQGSQQQQFPSRAKPQKYDKNKFLQANFRFLVSDAVDVSAYEADADKMFDWDDVLQASRNPPLCPQITPCGHVFSFPAIMHHLMNHGGEQLRRSAPCPLCFAPVVARELRLVRVRHVVQPRAGDQLTLALIRRTRTSIIPQPVDPPAAAAAAAAATTAATKPVSVFDRNPFAKFVVGGEASDLWRAAAEQLAVCATELVAEGGIDAALEAPYVYGALDQLAARARRWAEHRAECLAARGLLVSREGPGAAPEALGAAAEAAVKKMFTAAVGDATAAREEAVLRAEMDQRFPSLAPRPPPPPVGAASTGPGGEVPAASPRAAAAGAVKAGPPVSGTAGTIAAAAPLPAMTAAAAAAESPPPLSLQEPQLTFDAVFSEDETDEQAAEGGSSAAAAAGPPHAQPSSPTALGLVTPPELMMQAAPGSGSPPLAGALAIGGPSPASSAGAELLGSSPTTRLNTPGTQGEFYTYQAADGSWVFLNPLNLRCLLHAYGSYDSCPPVITARLLELEDVVQAEATRRRWRFLSHLPLAGAFKLCEVAMTDLLPQEALAPFADELAAREKRRRRQRADERRQAAAEAAAAARAAAARLGPSAEELQAMPSLNQAVGLGAGGAAAAAAIGGSNGGGGSGSGLIAAAGAAAAALAREIQLSPTEVAESIALQASLDEAAAATASPGPPNGGGSGVSFAHITKMGFAATGPALGSSPPSGSIAAAVPSGAWGARSTTAGSSSSSGASAGAPPLSNPWGGATAAATASAVSWGPWGAGKGAATIKAAATAAAVVGPGKSPAVAPDGSGEGAAAPGGGSAKKGKSGKGTLLFSTGNQRKY
ncbi:hypothetical protein VOLCADRAFT_105963 [Volvox carteri f. nagariensis]|uniref:RING-type domain-containing protein n=1 Tax=Volvox carteri f. nagariensis TaxID=3068 RepID=D8U4I6_VOLCA|nr:uncharacterized protein VOLCADRAFT_105963 [Volvox carteri f. nagariensis]EFJ45410.1 hypothetical protein VOLCADRAFT_105963 [Volvox carteri f. nagariensis]|eukprot:XP_002953437.1 hypothetical protein VOLCADRAFT_105963 [Volvox carteri f. nagariensis]